MKSLLPERIVFWQRIISPHMFGLAKSLQKQGWRVTYIVEKQMSSDRAGMGWQAPEYGKVEVIVFNDQTHINELVEKYKHDAIHLVQGVYANGAMENVRRALKRKKARWGAIMETVDERSWTWPLKRLVYRSRLGALAARPNFMLAIGDKTKDWVTARGFPAERVFPFSYYLELPDNLNAKIMNNNKHFCIGFAGSLVSLKRIDLLIEVVASLKSKNRELIIIGDGPLADELKDQAHKQLKKDQYSFLGKLPMDETRAHIAQFDCLVLPSDHDGWGAVVTEALMAGVPAICSDACGASLAVRASGVGGIFPKGSVPELRNLLKSMVQRGALPPEKRRKLAQWARCFGPDAGADYVRAVLRSVYGNASKPQPPWAERLQI